MPQLTPEQAGALLREVALPVLANEHTVTSKVISAIPEDKGDYRPDPVAMTSMELAWHIVSAELWFIDSVVAGAFDMTSRPRPESIRNSSDLASWYEAAFQARVEKIRGLSNEQAAKALDFRGKMELPAVMFLNLAARHSIHHRGQLSVYLRPMGAKVPAIYGESYDSAQAKAAQQA